MAEKMQITNRYDDIISLPHHQSKTRPHMPLIDRAAQFSPFAALTGYDDAVKETARQTERKAELSEEMQACLQEKLQILQAQISTKPEAILTYFEADEKKAGGTYRTVQGEIKRIDEYRRVIVLLEEERERGNDVPEIERRKEIPLEDLYGIEIL
ncbi:putative uncharacterized protein [Lachnospiraceae bacterium CAG:215]|nr:putative uncharacterized protein [Lachnospiraceae bacterium CAG:215]